MVLYDIFRKENRGRYPYKHIARKDFDSLDEVVAFCKRHKCAKFKFQEAAITDRQIEIGGRRFPVAAISKPEPQDEVQKAPGQVEEKPCVMEPPTLPEPIPGPLAKPGEAPGIEDAPEINPVMFGAIS